MYAPVTLDASSSLAGITVDEWAETVPSTVETTGIAFHYETPVAQAPQAVLLGVAPDLSEPFWTTESLEATIAEA
jgi:hypothetical protein